MASAGSAERPRRRRRSRGAAISQAGPEGRLRRPAPVGPVGWDVGADDEQRTPGCRRGLRTSGPARCRRVRRRCRPRSHTRAGRRVHPDPCPRLVPVASAWARDERWRPGTWPPAREDPSGGASPQSAQVVAREAGVRTRRRPLRSRRPALGPGWAPQLRAPSTRRPASAVRRPSRSSVWLRCRRRSRGPGGRPEGSSGPWSGFARRRLRAGWEEALDRWRWVARLVPEPG